MWIWIGIGFNLGLALLLTLCSGIALTFCNPVKMRPTTAADESAAKSAAAAVEIRKKRTERFIKSGARSFFLSHPQASKSFDCRTPFT